MHKQTKRLLEDLQDQMDGLAFERATWCDWFEGCQENILAVFDEILDLQSQILLRLENSPDEEGPPRPDPLPLSFSKYTRGPKAGNGRSDRDLTEDTDVRILLDF